MVKSEDIFKLVTCLVVAMWSICIKYFFEFRQYLQRENLEYFEFTYAWYILVSFLFMLVLVWRLRARNTATTRWRETTSTGMC